MDRVVHNAEIASLFEQVADLLAIEGANPFRVRAYRTAARTIAGLPREAASMVVQKEDLTDLPGIGEDLAGKISEIVSSGKLTLLEEVKKRIPEGLTGIVALPGVGPKRAKLFYDMLGVKNTRQLAAKIRSGEAAKINGIGTVTLQKIIRAIELQETGPQRFKLVDAESVGMPLLAFLEGLSGVEGAHIAGSYRRRKETVGDLDILLTGDTSKALSVFGQVSRHPEISRVLTQGHTAMTVVLQNGMQVDLRFVSGESLGAALHYFTGSKDHTIAVRAIAVKSKLKLNEYGLFHGAKRIAGKTEQEIYSKLGLDFIPPELRENRGEVQAASSHRLPRLLTIDDIRGDLHTHTSASDGTLTIAEMAEAAHKRGYEYLAITDHSKRVSVAHGLDERRLNAQIDEIDKFCESRKDIAVLKSCEVDILSDGKLDIRDETLKRLDFVYGAVHYNFTLSRKEQTERIIRAMDNPYFTILAHPTGRIINRRAPYEVDMERLLRAAAERDCIVEINAHPDRLDLNDAHCIMAKELGVRVAISTDAHSAEGLDMMRFGVDQARRGWLEKKDVVNTKTLADLRRILKRV